MLNETDILNLVDNAPRCEAKRSTLHGFGLFATTAIQQGEVIVDFSDPELYIETTFDELEYWRLEAGKFTALDQHKCLISTKFTKYSLLNHSRLPTAVLDLSRRQVRAARLIKAGEEITVDYRLEPMPMKVRRQFHTWL